MAGESSQGSTLKRKNYINWEEYFMGIALMSAKRSKDPNCQVGACIVNTDKKIVGVGYNSMPWGCNDDEFPWGKEDLTGGIEEKKFYVCHAEFNAVLNKNSSDMKDCTIYVTLFPCNECAKIIIQSRIKTIVYLSDEKAKKPKTKAAKKMFDAVGVTYRPYNSKNKNIEINFHDINWRERKENEDESSDCYTTQEVKRRKIEN